MMASIGDMVVKILGDITDFDKKLGEAEKSMKATSANMEKIGKGLTTFVTLPILAIGAAALKAASDMEVNEAAFTTMLGSAEKAKSMLADLRNFAAKTPFSLSDLAGASKTLLQFGLDADKVMPVLKSIGDVSGGNAQRFQSLSLAFGQAQSAGRLMGQDLLQMINAGFNPLLQISKDTGRSMMDLKKDMENGAISADMVTAAFKSATSEGGMFFGGMERGSQTLSGQLSTLKDEVVEMARSFGEVLLPIAKDIVSSLTDLAKGFQGMTDNQKKAVLITGGLVASIGPLLIGFAKTLQAVQLLTVAFKALAASQAMKDFAVGGAIGLGIGAITLAIYGMAVATKRAEENQKLYNNAIAGNLDLQNAQVALDLKRKDIAKAQLELLNLEAQAGRQGVAQAIQYKKQAIEQLQGEAAQIANVVSGLTRQQAEEARLAKIQSDTAVAAEAAAADKAISDAAEQARLDALQKGTKSYYDTVKKSDAERNFSGKKRIETIKEEAKETETVIELTDEQIIANRALQAAERARSAAAQRAAEKQQEDDALNLATQRMYHKGIENQSIAWTDFQNEKAAEAQETAEEIRALQEAELSYYFKGIGNQAVAWADLQNTKTQQLSDYYNNITEMSTEWVEKQKEADKISFQDGMSVFKSLTDLGDQYFENKMKMYDKDSAEYKKAARDQFIFQQALSVVNTTISGIEAGIKALAVLGPVAGGIAATAIGVLTAANVGMILSQKPPALAAGGIVMPSAGGTMAQIAEAGQPEVVFPLDKLEQFLSRSTTSQMSGEDIHLVVNLDSKPFLDKIFPATRNRTILISAGAVV